MYKNIHFILCTYSTIDTPAGYPVQSVSLLLCMLQTFLYIFIQINVQSSIVAVIIINNN